MPLATLLIGLTLGFWFPDAITVPLLARMAIIGALNALLALSSALVATLTRGYLASIGLMVCLVVLAQVAVFTSVGGWFPFAAPGLWAAGAVLPSATTLIQLLLVLPVGGIAAAWTLGVWRRLTL